jgi:hypothetical protein
LKLCNPAGNNGNDNRDLESGNGGTRPNDEGGGGGPNLPGQLPSDILDQILNLPPSAIDDLPQSVQDQLGLGGSGQSGPGQSGSGSGSGAGTGTGSGAAGDLLDFLFTTP